MQYTLSDEDRNILRAMIDDYRRRPKHAPRSRHRRSQFQTPDVFAASAPSGIPAATGSGSSVTPGSASCDIYRIVDGSPVAKMALSVKVYNLGTTAVASGAMIQVVRDKSGLWQVLLQAAGGGGTTISMDNYNYNTGVIYGSVLTNISYIRVDFSGTDDPLYINYGPLFVTDANTSIDPPGSAVLHVRRCGAYTGGETPVNLVHGRPGVLVDGDQYIPPGVKQFTADIVLHELPGLTGPHPNILWLSQAHDRTFPTGQVATWITAGVGEDSLQLRASDSLGRLGQLDVSSGGLLIGGATGADGSGWPNITIQHGSYGSVTGGTSDGTNTGGLKFQSGLYAGGTSPPGFSGTVP